MAVEKDRIKTRLKALFPGVNLSTTRLDALADRLSKKPKDNAEDSEIDEVLNNANDYHAFADIAKDDDRLRTLEAQTKKTPKTDPPATPPGTPPADPPADDTPAWAKELRQEIQALKTEKQQSTILQQAKEKLKDVPEVIWKRAALPEKAEDLDAWVEEIKTDYTAYKQENANTNANGGKPPVGSGGNTDTKPTAGLVDYVKQRVTAETKK